MRHLAKNNPEVVQFTDDEAWRVTRIRMARWFGGITPEQWDEMPYTTQCDALEIHRAEQFARDWDSSQAHAIAQAKRRSKGY